MYNSQHLTSKRSKVDLRDELAQLHLDDGAVKLDFQQLRICLDVLAGLAAVWREDSQHPHVAAHHHLVCRSETQEGTSRWIFNPDLCIDSMVARPPRTDRVHSHCCPRPQHTSILGQTPLLRQAQPTTSHGP